MSLKARLWAAGVHMFDRTSGWNLLLDDVDLVPARYSPAPRYVSVALTNACELRCSYCYAPKHIAALQAEHVLRWAVELDEAGCLGVGFGDGEPTTHPPSVFVVVGCRHRHDLPVSAIARSARG